MSTKLFTLPTLPKSILLKQTIYFYILLFLFQFIHVSVYTDLNISNQLLSNLIGSFFRLIFVCLMVFLSNSRPFSWASEECLKRKLHSLSIKKTFYIIIFAYLILFALIEVLIVKKYIIGNYLPAPVFSYIIRYLSGAILEEVFFKAFVFRVLKTKTSFSLAIIGVMTAVLFSLLHTQYYNSPLSLFEIFLWQFFSIVLFNYYPSLFGMVIVHFSRNFFMYIVKGFV